jgi:hypothetical protein
VTALIPAAAKAGGGTSVTVTGTGFLTATGVSFGGTAGTSLVVVSDTSVTILAPAHAAGQVDVLVTNTTGTSGVVAADKFTYDTTPTVTALNPAAGKAAGGTSVTVTGTGFLTATAVSFGGTAGTSLVVVSDTSLTILAPAHAIGVVDVLVTNTTGTSTNVVADNFTYDTTPAVTALSPTYGATGGGTTVTVTGTSFLTATGVTFGGSAGTSLTIVSDTSLTIRSPAHAAGVVDVLVTNTTGTSTNVVADNFTYVAPPSVTAISTYYGPIAGGTSVTVTGTGFTAASVTIAGTAVTPTVISDTSMTIVSPAHAIGVFDIFVTNLLGTSASTAYDMFWYIAPATVTAISPNYGTIAGGTSITVTGTGFTNASVTIGGTAVTPTILSDTSMTVVSPPHAAGVSDVLVTMLLGTSPNGAADNFTFVGPPTVTGVSPASGTARGGTTVTLTGSGFGYAVSGVSFGGTAGTSLAVGSDTSLTIVSPVHLVGPVDVRVTTAFGTSAVVAGDVYTYVLSFLPQGSKLTGAGETGIGMFGYVVALSADGNTALVGGPSDNTAVGAAWVYTRSGTTWTQQGSKLTGLGEIYAANYGIGVALSADGNTPQIGPNGDNAVGAVWVYTRSGGVWTQQGSKLTGAGATATAGFGAEIALSNDGNTALIGGYGDNSMLGAAWVFTRSGGVWTAQGSKLTGAGATANATFGARVRLSADGNTALIGGPGDNASVGAAWVFTRSGGVWTAQGSKLTGAGETGAGVFGFSVALSDDGNTALIGGNSDNTDVGAAWVFTRSGPTWTAQGSKLTGVGETGAGKFGYSVSLSGDGNTALIGGVYDNGTVGAAWVFGRSASSTWLAQGSKLTGPGEVGLGYFGAYVALSDDGYTALIGGYTDNGQIGAAWVRFLQ